MASHHYLGAGALSEGLRTAADAPDELADRVAAMVRDSGLEVVDRKVVTFEGGGHTFVWVLAESHLVLHHWGQEGFATIDLHVCDYRESNAGKAAALRKSLESFCFDDGTAEWRELELPQPHIAP